MDTSFFWAFYVWCMCVAVTEDLRLGNVKWADMSWFIVLGAEKTLIMMLATKNGLSTFPECQRARDQTHRS